MFSSWLPAWGLLACSAGGSGPTGAATADPFARDCSELRPLGRVAVFDGTRAEEDMAAFCGAHNAVDRLVVRYTPLDSLPVLDCLCEVRSILISDNMNLTSVTVSHALPVLEELEVARNDVLESILWETGAPLHHLALYDSDALTSVRVRVSELDRLVLRDGEAPLELDVAASEALTGAILIGPTNGLTSVRLRGTPTATLQDLVVTANDDLRTFALGGVGEIEQAATFLNNPQLDLPAIDGFAFPPVVARLELDRNEALTDIGHFAGVTEVGDLLWEDGGSRSAAFPRLEVVHHGLKLEEVVLGGPAFSALRRVEGDLWVDEVVAGATVFDALDLLGGDFDVRGSSGASLTDLPALRVARQLEVEPFERVGGPLRLPALQSAGRVSFDGAGLHPIELAPTLLSSLDLIGVDLAGSDVGLVEVGDFRLTSPRVPGGQAVPAWPLERTSTIEISGWSDAGSLAVFGSLAAITQELEIRNSPGLEAIHLPELQELGALMVDNNVSLTSLSSLGSVTELGDVSLLTSPLAALTGLRDVATVGQLQLMETGLVTLDDLASLREVDGSLWIQGNAALTDVSGLAGITSITGDVRIVENPQLPTANAQALIAAIGRENIGGSVQIDLDAP